MAFLNQAEIVRKYRSEKILWGKTANRYVMGLSALIKKGKILDLGCGEGRNALFLAGKGFEVTGVDISENAVEKLSKNASKAKVKLHSFVNDIAYFEFGKKWDGIICNAVLHLLPKEKMGEVIGKMKKHTRKGGINVITAFSIYDVGFKKYPALSFVRLADIIKLYGGWKLVRSEYYIKHDTHGGPHDHHLVALVAIK